MFYCNQELVDVENAQSKKNAQGFKPTRHGRNDHGDHNVLARHNKFGTFQVPKTFLSLNKAAAECALKVAEKQLVKGAAKSAAEAEEQATRPSRRPRRWH